MDAPAVSVGGACAYRGRCLERPYRGWWRGEGLRGEGRCGGEWLWCDDLLAVQFVMVMHRCAGEFEVRSFCWRCGDVVGCACMLLRSRETSVRSRRDGGSGSVPLKVGHRKSL